MTYSWHLYSESVTGRSRIYGWSTSETPTCVAWLIISQLKKEPELFVVKLEQYSEPMHQEDRYREGSPDPIRSEYKVWPVKNHELSPEVLEDMLDWSTNQFTPMQLLKGSLQ
jgi:hypothetical protein